MPQQIKYNKHFFNRVRVPEDHGFWYRFSVIASLNWGLPVSIKKDFGQCKAEEKRKQLP